MRYWWAVNVAELAQLQRKILDRVKATFKDKEDRTLELGVITTIAATAHLGTTVPYILTPPVDFDLEESPQKLWDMTYALCWPQMKDRADQINAWKSVLKDLVPPKDQDPAGVPVSIQGVQYLAEIAEHFARNHEGDVRTVSILWKELERCNKSHARHMAETEGRLPTAEHSEWRTQVLEKLNAIRLVVERSFDTNIQALT